MQTKVCKTCTKEKDIDEFPIQNTKLNLYRAHCKECYSTKRKETRLSDIDKLENSRKINREYYYDNKEIVIKNIKNYQKLNPDKLKVWQKTFRDNENKKWKDFKNTLKCIECGEDNGACLDFHHINPKEKTGLVSKLRYFKNKIQEEIEKCIVLCANCHRKLHAKEKENINNNNI